MDGSDAWLERTLGYLDASGSTAGVIVAMASAAEAASECSDGTVSPNGHLAHPWPEEVLRMKGGNAAYLGTPYMRFPRWGTLVSHDHLAALGGLDAVDHPAHRLGVDGDGRRVHGQAARVHRTGGPEAAGWRVRRLRDGQRGQLDNVVSGDK